MNENNDSEKQTNQQENMEQSSAENEVTTNADSESDSGSPSLFQRFILWWIRAPGTVKSAIGATVYHIILILGFVLLLIFAIAAATAISETLMENIYGVGEGVQNFLSNIAGKLFTEKLFLTDEEWAEKQEKKYYQELSKVHTFYIQNYGVSIDTTLITATLFYGRGMTDYIDDKAIDSMEEGYLPNDENIIQDSGDFYKAARAHIKTLAKFQIVENTSYNACPNNYEPQSKITPESDKEVADTWAGFYGWNTRATFNYQSYQTISHPKIDGSARNITWCEFQNAEGQLKDHYVEDYEIYKPYQDSYNSCVTACKAQQTCVPDPKSATGKKICTSTCDPDTACATQKEEKDKYLGLLKNTWGDVFSIGDDSATSNASFKCSPSTTWGSLNEYSDRKWYHNSRFPEDWIDKAENYTFWKTAIDLIEASILGTISDGIYKIDCSAKPSIMHTYSTSIEREGVYYYKLLSRSAEFLSNKNFIEKYYPNYIGASDNDDQRMQDAIKIVDEIYDVYEYAIQDRQYCEVNSFTSGSTFVGESESEFVNLIANTVVEDMNRTGVLASVTIAQAMLESAHGKSSLTMKYNNYYGQTAGKCASNIPTSIKGPIPPGSNGNTCSGNDYWNGTVVRMCNSSGADCQWYRVYDGFENSTADHSMTFLRKNFNYCDSRLSDPLAYVSCLKERPDHMYATDPNYVSKIMSVINKYNLTQYDIGAPSSSVMENQVPNVGSSGNTELESLSEKQCIPRTSTIGMGTISTNGSGSISGSGGAQGIRFALDRSSQDYITYWGSNNNLYYASNRKLVNECTWYAHGRGLEILTKNGMSMETAQMYMNPMAHNAWTWYRDNKYFSTSTDYTNPKIGAIVVWSKNDAPGHVAIIEDIKYGPNGEILGITTSEGGQSIGGFKYTEGRNLEYMRAHGNYRFVGYIYLLN